MNTFPVKVPYKTMPSMNKNTESVFTISRDNSSKLRELARWDNELYHSRRDDLVDLARDKIGIKLRDFGHSSSIVNFALNFKEDVALLHQGVLEAICFCYPSSWIPSERVGQSLAQIHAPVADGKILVEKSQRIAETMATQSSFRRYVWTISSTGALSNHPKMKKPPVTDDTTIDNLYFRTETQTTLPLGDNLTSLFFVDVATVKLNTVWSDSVQRRTICDSINSMSDSVLQYKNLIEIKEIVNKNA